MPAHLKETSICLLDDEKAQPLCSPGWRRWDGKQTLDRCTVLLVNAEALISGRNSRSEHEGLRVMERILADPTNDPAGVAVVAFERWEELQERWKILRPKGFLPFARLPLSCKELHQLAGGARHLSTRKPLEWRRLRASAFEAIVTLMLRPLIHGGRLDVVNKGAAATRAAIKAVRDGLLSVDDLKDLLAKNAWWLGIGDALMKARSAVSGEDRAGFVSGHPLQGLVMTLSGAVQRFIELVRTVQSMPPSTDASGPAATEELATALAAAEADLATLMRSTGDFQRGQTGISRE